MKYADPGVRVDFVVEAIARLQVLEREMARFSRRDKNYEAKLRALRAAISRLP
jgi:predicted  nucleic acid-binding Zn-ribbon protein